MRNALLLLLSLAFTSLYAQQQQSPFPKFGKIKAEHLKNKVYSIDSSASAVVLSDVGEASIEGNVKGWFSLTFKRHTVVHILNKNGFDAADIEIDLYVNDQDEERLESVKAITYNLDGEKLTETKLEKNNIFKEQISKYRIRRKFTMPNVKEGSIIEIEYKVTSDFIGQVDPWLFQNEHPTLWSEYNFSAPNFFIYSFLYRGHYDLAINDRKERQGSYTILQTRSVGATGSSSFTSTATDYRWVMKDVPEIKTENFTSTIKNHIARMEVQLSAQTYPLTHRDYKANWVNLTKHLLESEYFAGDLKENNKWLADEMKTILNGASTEKEKAEKIFAFVRDNIECNRQHGVSLSQTLKNVWKAKKGNIADVNLLLAAMLRHAGLSADPVILSTRDNGYPIEAFPMLNNYNYVICQTELDGIKYFLDASLSKMGFGKLPSRCYNGNGRIIAETPAVVNLSTDHLTERKTTALFISNSEKGGWDASYTQTPGYYESYQIREKIKDKGQEEYFKEVKKAYTNEVTISNLTVDSLTKYDESIQVRYNIKFSEFEDDVIYINPLFGEGFKKNPFQAVERSYPVEMPYGLDETFLLTMEIPKGYEIDELPKQYKANYDEAGRTFFEYLFSKSGNTISLRARLRVSRSIFNPVEYENLREFFNFIVNTQNQQIVFKKKK